MNISETNPKELHAKMVKDLLFVMLEKKDVSIEIKIEGKLRKLNFRYVKTWRGKTVIGVNLSFLRSSVRDVEDELFYSLAIEDTSLEGFTNGLADLLVYLGADSGLHVDAGEIKIESGIGYDWNGQEEEYFNTYQTNRLFLNGVLVLTYDFWTELEGTAARFKRVPRICISGWEEDKYDKTDEGFMFFDFILSSQNDGGDRQNPMKELFVIM